MDGQHIHETSGSPRLTDEGGKREKGWERIWTPLKQHYRLARTWQTMLYLFFLFY